MFVPLARRPRLRRAVTLQSRSAGRRDARGPPPHACRAPRADNGMHWWRWLVKCWSAAPLSAVAPSRRRATAPYASATVYYTLPYPPSAVCHWGWGTVRSCLCILIRRISDKLHFTGDPEVVLSTDEKRTRFWYAIESLKTWPRRHVRPPAKGIIRASLYSQ